VQKLRSHLRKSKISSRILTTEFNDDPDYWLSKGVVITNMLCPDIVNQFKGYKWTIYYMVAYNVTDKNDKINTLLSRINEIGDMLLASSIPGGTKRFCPNDDQTFCDIDQDDCKPAEFFTNLKSRQYGLYAGSGYTDYFRVLDEIPPNEM
jgi:hypothetical protein